MVTHKEAVEIATEAYDNTATHRYGIEMAINAYVAARGLAMVPKVLTEGIYDALHRYASEADVPAAWNEILAAAPDPFKDDAP